jgi:hypothetical protein
MTGDANTSTKAGAFSVLRADIWQALSQRLDDVVVEDALLALMRDSVLRPLRLLEAMAADAPAALGDDFLAAERLRVLLYLAAPWRALPAEAAQLAAGAPAAQSYQPGVLHHGRLVIVGLAAVRVAPAGTADDLLATIHGLALALSAVEVFGRLGPAGPGGDALETILRTLVGLGDVSGYPTAGLLRPFSLDATERGRWACLAQLFGGDALGSFVGDRLRAERNAEGADAARWDATDVEAVASVHPPAAPPGGEIELRGRFGAGGERRGRAGDAAAELDVVFVDADGTPRVATPRRRTATTLTVMVPRDARTGWVGVSDPARLARSNEYRRRVRGFWAGLGLPAVPARPAGFLDCLREAPVPVELVPDLGRPQRAAKRLVAVPPRTATNRFSATPDGSRAGTVISHMGTGGVTTRLTQKRRSPPFVAGEAVDVAVAFPAGVTNKVTLLVDPTGLAASFSAKVRPGDTAAEVKLPAKVVVAGVLDVALYFTAPGATTPTLVGESTFAVERARIVDVEATQGGAPPPFVEDEPVRVDVSVDAADDDGPPLEVYVQAATGERLGPGALDDGRATLTIPAEEVAVDALVYTVTLEADGAVIDRVDRTEKVTEAPLVISDVAVAQGTFASPFQAGAPLDVSVAYSPPARAVRATLSLGGAIVTNGDGAAGTARASVPAASVVAGSLDLVVELFEIDGSRTATAKKEVKVIALALGAVTATQSDHGPPFVADRPVDVVVTYAPDSPKAELDLLLSDADTAPLEPRDTSPGQAEFEIPSVFVTPDKLDFTVRAKLPKDGDGTFRDHADASYPVFVPLGVRLVVFRPTILAADGPRQVTADDLAALVARYGHELGLDIEVHELPWAEDTLAVIGSDVSVKEDPRVPVLWDALSRAAAFTSGLEAALWVVLVPASAGVAGLTPAADVPTRPPLVADTPAESAVVVAVCDGPGLGDLLKRSKDLLTTARPVVARLRLVGTFGKDSNEVTLQAAREEPRAAGPGATKDSGLDAVLLDVDARPLRRFPVNTVRDAERAGLVQLLPVTPEVERVQLRRRDNDKVVAELQRPAGQPSLTDFSLYQGAEGPALQWSYTHTKAASPTLQFELVDGQGTFAFEADSCFDSVYVPKQRLPPDRDLAVQLVATDGWNTAFTPPAKLSRVENNLVIRRVLGVLTPPSDKGGAAVRLAGAQWWADTTLPGPFFWTFNGKAQLSVDGDNGHGRIIQLDAGARGRLRVEGNNEEGKLELVDVRDIV